MAIATPSQPTIIKPQPGPQVAFLASPCSITIYGGSAGGGKSYALLLDALRYAALEPVPNFGAVIFRRTSPQITATGGLWEESGKLYPLAGGKPHQTRLEWRWPQHPTHIRFSHMQYESDMYAWQGSQLAYVGFDELSHFTQDQFFYMLSRNRSSCGIRPRIRGTTNPDADSWVKSFLAPWVDDTYPDPAVSGEVRYLLRESGVIRWYRSRADIPPSQRNDAKSVTFIAASIYDNPKLLATNPEYLASLKALSPVERERLLEGNWNIRPSGNMFKRHWFPLMEYAPPCLQTVRYWDLAGTEKRKGNDPDWTVGVKMGAWDGGYCVLDVVRERMTPKGVKDLILRTAAQDGALCPIWIEQEGGSAGKFVASDLTQALDGYDVHVQKPTANKEFRARPFSAQCEAGHVSLMRAYWNDAYLNTLCAFPDSSAHDDDVDSSSGAYGILSAGRRGVAFAAAGTSPGMSIPKPHPPADDSPQETQRHAQETAISRILGQINQYRGT